MFGSFETREIPKSNIFIESKGWFTNNKIEKCLSHFEALQKPYYSEQGFLVQKLEHNLLNEYF